MAMKMTHILMLFVLSLSSVRRGAHAFSSSVAVRHGLIRRSTSSSSAVPSSTSSLLPLTRRGASESSLSTEESEITLNPLLSSIKISKTVEIFGLVKQMQSEGIDVTSLCVGEPDFPPPRSVLDAAVEALAGGDTRYTAVTGTLALRQAIASDLKRRKHITYDPLAEIVVGNGAKQCVYQSILATVGENDEVLVPAPYWPSYPEMVRLVGATPIILETKEDDGYLLTPDALHECLAKHPNVKMLILCNPSNPTGGVHGAQCLKELAKVLEKYPKVAVLADEIYERLVYVDDDDDEKDEDPCPSFASMPHMFHRTYTINGFSKSHAMTGFRLGYVAAPSNLAKAVTTIQSQLTSCAGSVSQAAGVAALNDVSDEELNDNVDIMKKKRDYVLERLDHMTNVRLPAVPPSGAFYVLPDISQTKGGTDDAEWCLDLLKEQRLALVPGSSFGATGTVRISYATSLEELKVAMDKLEAFLESRS